MLYILARDKHSSLFALNVNDDESFITFTQLMSVFKLLIKTNKPVQPGIMFGSKAGAYPRVSNYTSC